MLSRRQFLQSTLACAVSGIGIWTYGWQVEPHWLEVVKRPLPIVELPSALDGARLVQLSDVHVGLQVPEEYVLDTFRRVALLKPDIVVVTGDWITYHSAVFAQAVSVYSHLPHGRLATVGVLGNHDYGDHWSHPEIADALVEILRAQGVQILRNECREVAGLQVVGMDDLWARRFEPEQALKGIDAGRSSVVLSHNPDTVDLAGWRGFTGWVLAGHTHGGQIRVPLLRPPILPLRNRLYAAGEFSLSGGRRMYVNRGVGHLKQVRFDVRPEVTVFELKCA